MKKIDMTYMLKHFHTHLLMYHRSIDEKYAKDTVKVIEGIARKYFKSLAIVHKKEEIELTKSLLALRLNENMIDHFVGLIKSSFLDKQQVTRNR